VRAPGARAVATSLVLGVSIVTGVAVVGRTQAKPGGVAASRLGSAVISESETSVLTTASALQYVPSRRTLDLQSARSMLSDAGSMHFARAVGAVRLFVAPGRRSNEVCLIVEDADEPSTAVDCAPRSVLTTGAVYVTKPDDAARTVDLFALVGDGVTSVASTTVENNVAVVSNLSGQVIELRNKVGQTSMVDLGPQF
jgi:hypothetical protein